MPYRPGSSRPSAPPAPRDTIAGMQAVAERTGVSVIVAAFAAIAIAAGIFLRFDNLGGKVFWQDESYTALHATGHLDRGDLRPLFDGQIRTAAELRALQRVDPSRGMGRTISAIAQEDSDQGALYYAFERAVIQADGGSIVTFRLVGALAGVLTIAAGFLLALELFGSALDGAIFAAILALSPFEVLYAHEARSYTLTALMALVTSALVLRALSKRSPALWAAYAAAMALGLYASLLLALVAFAHAVYVAAEYRTDRAALRNLLLALAGAVVLYVPWLAIAAAHRGMVATELDWGATPYPLRLMIEKWLFNANAQFFDLEWLNLKYALAGAGVLLLMAVSLVVLVRTAPARVWRFVIALAFIPGAFFIGRDLLLHAHWSTTARYLIPTWLGCQLAVAWTIARCVDAEGISKNRMRAAGVTILGAVLLLEGVSSYVNTRAPSWYNDELSAGTPALASAVNAHADPLLIGVQSWAFFLDASNYLRPDVHVELFSDPRTAIVKTAGYKEVFVPTPPAAFVRTLKREGYALRLVYSYRGAAAPYAAFHAALKKHGPQKLPVNRSVSFPNELYAVVRDGTAVTGRE